MKTLDKIKIYLKESDKDNFIDSQIDYYKKHLGSGSQTDRNMISGLLDKYQQEKNKIKKFDIYKFEGDIYRVKDVYSSYVILQYKTGPKTWSNDEIELHIENFKNNYKKVTLRESNEEEVDREYNFERFINIISKLSSEDKEGGEKEEIKISANPGTEKSYRRIIMNRKDFDILNNKFTGDKNIVNVSNKNGFYVFANDRKVVLAEYKDYPVKPYAYNGMIIIGKKDLD